VSGARRAAVVGGGLGGLTAAGELAQAGFAVTLFERARSTGGKAASVVTPTVRLDLGPTLLTMPEVVRGTFERLGALDLLPRLHELPLQCRYAWPDGSGLEVWRAWEPTANSAAGLFPEAARELSSFYAEAERIYEHVGAPYLEAPYESALGYGKRLWARGPRALATGMGLSTLAALARRHFSEARLQQFAGRFATYAGASPFEASASFALIPHLERAQGVFHPEGGMGALASALEAAVKRLGVTVQVGVEAQFGRRGSETWAGPAGGESAFEAVVVNADPLRFLRREGEPLAMSGYVLCLDVDRRLSLPHHSVLFSADERAEFGHLAQGAMPSDATVYLCHPAATDPTMAAPGHSGLFVMLNAPAMRDQGLTWSPSDLRAQCLGVLERAVPELRGAKVTVVAERTPLDFARLGAPGGSLYGFVPRGRLGPFKRPHLRSPEKGIFFAGGGTFPGGGVPMVMLSGRYASALAAAEVLA
jgi:1-hydroxycarotenoid 3,4-desaturase